MQRATGGRNPFSNIGVRYTGSTDDAALNRDVARFAADPAAAAAVKADGDPTGVLPVPVVTIHSINDPVVAVEEDPPIAMSSHPPATANAWYRLSLTTTFMARARKVHRNVPPRSMR